MFDNLRKNSYGNIQVRVYFEDLDIVEHYLTRFEKALHKVRIVGDKLKRYIKKNKIKSDIEKENMYQKTGQVFLKINLRNYF